MIFRILTEYRDNLPELTERYFDGFNFTHGIDGYWKGGREMSAVIEIDSIGMDYERIGHTRVKVYALAADIKRENNQQAVLVQEIAAESRLA